MAHTVQVARRDLELTPEREQFLTLTVEQGALAFERWFGRAPDRAAMWRAVTG